MTATPGPGTHPHLLPWFTAGRLEASERAEIEQHLAACAECREHVAALESVRSALQRQSAAHPTVEELTDYAERGPGLDAERRERLGAHLQDCAACREDLEVARELGGQQRPPATRRWRATALVGAAAVLLLVAVGLPIAKLRSRPGPTVQLTTPLVLEPAQRSEGDGISRLAGSGPWVLTILLPPAAEPGEYMLHVRRELDGRDVRPPTVLSIDASGAVTLIVDGLRAGRYRVVLVRGDSTARHEYSFEVVP